MNEKLKALDAEIRALEDKGEDTAEKTKEFEKLADVINLRQTREQMLEKTAGYVRVGETESEKIAKGRIFRHVGHFCQEVYKAGPNGRDESETMRRYKAACRNIEKAVGSDEMAVMPDNEGGYLVPEEYSNKLIQRICDYGVVKPNCARIPMQTNRISIPAVNDKTDNGETFFGGVVVYYKAERTQLTAVKPDFRMVTLDLHKLTALVPVTDELLTFSPISISAWLNEAVPRAIASKEDKVFLLGTGAGQPRGAILDTTRAITPSRGTATTVKYADLVNMYRRLFMHGAMRPFWVFNQAILGQLMTLSFEGTSSSTPAPGWSPWVPAGVMGNKSNMLLGFPAYMSNHMSTLGTAKDIALIDGSQYLIGEKGGIEAAVSIHLRFDYDETMFRWILYHDGQSAWDAVFTPDNGDTLAPAVYLT